jgi:hypothetical protein
LEAACLAQSFVFSAYFVYCGSVAPSTPPTSPITPFHVKTEGARWRM